MPRNQEHRGGEHDDQAHLASQLAHQGIKVPGAPRLHKLTVKLTQAEAVWLHNELTRLAGAAASCAAAPSTGASELLSHAARAHLAGTLADRFEWPGETVDGS